MPGGEYDQGVQRLRGLRLGLLLDAGCGLPVEAEVRAAVEHAARLFEQAGAQVSLMQPFMTQAMLDGMNHFWRMRSYTDLQALPEAQRAKGAALHPRLGRERCGHAPAPRLPGQPAVPHNARGHRQGVQRV